MPGQTLNLGNYKVSIPAKWKLNGKRDEIEEQIKRIFEESGFFEEVPAKEKNPDSGLGFQRLFTKEGVDPFATVTWTTRDCKITNPDGSVVFEMKNAEIPAPFTQVASDVMISKYFRKAGVPQYDEYGNLLLTDRGTPKLGPESSAKQVISRLVGCWRYWGEQYGYFKTEQDAIIFEDELKHMLVHQMAAPNSPQWFNTGINWAYNITGKPQGHYYVDPDTEMMVRSEDAYTRPQPHACGRYNTKLFTEKGIRNLGEIVDKNQVGLRVFDGMNWTKILATKCNGIRKLYRMHLSNGNYIDFTHDHRIYAAKKRIKEAGAYSWTELKDCVGKKTQQIISPVQKAQSHYEERAIEKAALAGYHIGDGYTGTYNKSTHFGAITINKDEYDDVSTLMNAVFGTFTETKKPHISSSYTILRHDFKETIPYSKEYELGLGSKNARVPRRIFTATSQEQRAFLQRLFQADGCVRIRDKNGRNSGDVTLSTISYRLAHEVQILLLNLGIYSQVSPCRDKRKNRHTLYQIIIAYESERKKFEKQINFVSQNKREKLALLNRLINGKNKKPLSEETVTSIEYIGEEPVYDIQTETGCFLANGVKVHNCFIQSIEDDLVNKGGIMDLWTREARIFKYGSGTGTNFSTIRGKGETLSGGGSSSGLMSFLKIGDRAAGAIKSGGTTRRAAKMVCLDMDHPEIEKFITWKANEEKKVQALVDAGYESDYEGEAYQTVSGQNSNNSIRVPNEFMHALDNETTWDLKWRTDGRVCESIPAHDLWGKIAESAWRSADPGIQYHTTINEWHTCPESGPIRASNPCSEYMFLDDTACNLASINLMKFFDNHTNTVNVEAYKHAIRLWTVVLEISVLMAQFPSKSIAQKSYDFRTLGLGYANLGTLLMVSGIPYDSDQARGIAAALTAILTGESYATSAELAKHLGAFAKYEKNKKHMLRVMRNHKRAAYGIGTIDEHKEALGSYEELETSPIPIDPLHTPDYLLLSARTAWDKALVLGTQWGYRNAQTTVIAPTGTIGLLMDCDTTGVEPDFALVKFKKLAGGGYWKIPNQSIEPALRNLGYSDQEVDDILNYIVGVNTLDNSSPINRETLREKGLSEEDNKKIEAELEKVFELKFAFTKYTLGEECMKRLDISPEKYNSFEFNLLDELGFSREDQEAANKTICGHMTIESAPHMRPEQLSVFDCANKCGEGERFIAPLGHVRMLGATQPFISGSISKTINLPHETTVQEIEDIYHQSWGLALKSVALYRDGSKLSQPLSTKSKDDDTASSDKETEKTAEATLPDATGDAKQLSFIERGTKKDLPQRRKGITIESTVGGHKLFLRTGEYEDGTLGEFFIDMHKEGAAFRSLLNCFAIAVSIGMQYGVPLKKLVDKFTFTRFEPNGMTDHPNIRNATSIIDFIFRILGMEYLNRTDFVHVPPEEKALPDEESPQNKPLQTEKPKQGTPKATEQTKMLPTFETIEKKSPKAHPNEAPFITETMTTLSMDQMSEFNSSLMGDAPACCECGHITVRNGSCYRCLNCGASMGCS